jgi:hypothetical protein
LADDQEGDERIFNLDLIPSTINNINQNLVRFTGYMLESYDIHEENLPALEGTKFTEVR